MGVRVAQAWDPRVAEAARRSHSPTERKAATQSTVTSGAIRFRLSATTIA